MGDRKNLASIGAGWPEGIIWVGLRLLAGFTKFKPLAGNLRRRMTAVVPWYGFHRASAPQMDDRRTAGRTRTSKAASIFFGRQQGERSCDVEVTDLADGGAGIYKPGLALLPLTFELSLGNLRRKCRMVWRKGNFFGVTFEDQTTPAISIPDPEEAEVIIEGPAYSMLADPPQLVRADNAGPLTEFASKITERSSLGRSDVRFTVGVAVVLALPVLISLGAYVATTSFFAAG
jgi:hypothetical protein